MKKHVNVFLSICVVLVSLFPLNLSAGWMQYYGTPSLFESGYSVLETSDKGYIVSASNVDYTWIIKTDSLGETVWEKFYNPGRYNNDRSYIRKTSDGGYILTGSGFKLLKLDNVGDSMWAYPIDYPYRTYWVEQTLDGGYITIGEEDTFFSDEGFASRIWLTKTDASGSLEWEKYYGEHASDSIYCGYCVQQTSDGNYIACGHWMNKLWLAKIDTTGELIWSNAYDLGLAAYSVRETSDSGFIMCGGASSPYIYHVLVVVKTDPNGIVEWSRTYGDEENISSAEAIRQTPEGGFVLTGTRSISYKSDILVQSISEAGVIQWTKFYGDTLSDEIANGIEVTSDSGYAIVGTIWWNKPEQDNCDAFLLKLNENGDTSSTTFISEPVTPYRPVTSHRPVTRLEIIDPIGSQITLRYSNCPHGFYAQVFDASGCKMDEIYSPNHYGILVWGPRHNPGVYFIRVAGEGAATHKVVLIR